MISGLQGPPVLDPTVVVTAEKTEATHWRWIWGQEGRLSLVECSNVHIRLLFFHR